MFFCSFIVTRRAPGSYGLWLAELTFAAAIGSPNSISTDQGWQNQGVDEQDRCSEDEQNIFHRFSPC
jgi:hypothetical protein